MPAIVQKVSTLARMCVLGVSLVCDSTNDIGIGKHHSKDRTNPLLLSDPDMGCPYTRGSYWSHSRAVRETPKQPN